MLYHVLTDPSAGMDVEQIEIVFDAPVDASRLVDAWNAATERHPILRTRFLWKQTSVLMQDVLPYVDIPVEHVEIRAGSPDDYAAQVETFLEEDRRRGIAMDVAPLMRLSLIRREGVSDRLIWTFSHAILDGRSFTRLLLEVFDAYDGTGPASQQTDADRHSRDAAPGVDAKPYRAYVEWVERQDWADSEAYWTDVLKGFSSPTSLSSVTRRTGPGAPSSTDPESNGARPFTDTEPQVAEVDPLRGRQSIACPADGTDRIRKAAEDGDVTVSTLVNAAWGLVLSRYTRETDVIFGATRAGRKGTIDGADDMVGVFINTVPLRVQIDTDRTVRAWLQDLRKQWVDHRPYEHMPLTQIQGCSSVPRTETLFESLVVFERYHLETHLRNARENTWGNRQVRLLQHTGYPFTLYGYDGERLCLDLEYDPAICSETTAERLLRNVQVVLADLSAGLDRPLREIGLLSAPEKETLLHTWNDTAVAYDVAPMHTQFEQQVSATPDARALSFGGVTRTYAELNARAEQIATVLQQNGVSAGDRVGVCLPRSLDMVATLYGILKTGAAYVPLDPDYPADRIAFMIEDAGLACIASASGINIAGGQSDVPCPVVGVDQIADHAPRSVQPVQVSAGDIAYVIYTSGSTGKPKGVMVTHGNAANFFAGMDERIERHDDRPNVWLSVTSISFDISVLELFWTLSRGFEVVLQSGGRMQVAASTAVEDQVADAVPSTGDGAPMAASDGTATVERPVAFSLFYFSSDEKLDAPGAQATQKYQMLLDGAAFADRNGFEAVWTPERHFHDFGGLYPNPSVISAAIAARTQNVQIRAGSCVSPLHHPVRIAEDWSVVDNLSNGRVGISFAAGWQPNDFVIQPQNFADRKSLMFEQIEDVRALWRGESRTYEGPTGDPVEVQTLPRPVQNDLPVWITAAGNPETFRMAGEGGYNLLTHLLGQSVEELTEKLAIYREAWTAAGHPDNGQATLMLHTFVGDDEAAVKAAIREPMKSYLRSSIALIKKAAWSFPAFKKRTTDLGGAFSLDGLSEEEIDAVLDYAFERYYKNSGLFGTPAQCMDRVAEVTAAGIDEIACLLDFGLPAQTVVEHLPYLCEVKDASDAQWADHAPDAAVHAQGDGQPVGSAPVSSSSNLPSVTPSTKADGVQATIPENIAAYGVTHLQCTPSQARMLVADADTREALRTLDHMMVGGEAFPPALAHQLRHLVSGRVTNMYGPTETTIWSSTWDVADVDGTVPIGQPIANTSIFLLDEQMRPIPLGVPGVLWIGGDGVTLGYLGREALTAERFVPNPFGDGRIYNTGDVARYAEDGTLHFLGRNDFQVKIRGHRIELGEIEAALETQAGVRSAVVVVRTTGDGQEGSYDQSLVAYLLPTPGATLDRKSVV